MVDFFRMNLTAVKFKTAWSVLFDLGSSFRVPIRTLVSVAREKGIYTTYTGLLTKARVNVPMLCSVYLWCGTPQSNGYFKALLFLFIYIYIQYLLLTFIYSN